MMNSGPSGFNNAPISKSILVVTAVSSIVISVMNLRTLLDFPDLSCLTTKFEWWRLLTHHLFFISAGEMLFGSVLIYFFRLFERQMGSIKFGGLTFLSFVISTILKIGLLVLFPMKNLSSGPYSYIFACFVQFYSDVPVIHRFRICGVNANDKLFTYILGLQLLFSDGLNSFLSGLCGILSGVLYRSDALKLRNFEFPDIVNNFCSRFILPLLYSPPPRVSRRNPISIPTNITRAQNSNNPVFPNGGMQAVQAFSNQFSANDPLNAPITRVQNFNNFVPSPNEESVVVLTSMGFHREEVITALIRANNDITAATNLLLEQ